MQDLFQPPSPFTSLPAKGPSEHIRFKSLSFNQRFKLHLLEISRMNNTRQEKPFSFTLSPVFPQSKGYALSFHIHSSYILLSQWGLKFQIFLLSHEEHIILLSAKQTYKS